MSREKSAIWALARANRPTMPPMTWISALENLSAARTAAWFENVQPPLIAAECAISWYALAAVSNSREQTTLSRSFHSTFRYCGIPAESLKTVGMNGRSNPQRMLAYIRRISGVTSCSSYARLRAMVVPLWEIGRSRQLLSCMELVIVIWSNYHLTQSALNAIEGVVRIVVGAVAAENAHQVL